MSSAISVLSGRRRVRDEAKVIEATEETRWLGRVLKRGTENETP